MTAQTATVHNMPITFSVAYANTVQSASINRSFTTKTLADAIAAERPVDQSVVDGLAKRHSGKELANAIKRMRPIFYPGRYLDGAKTRNSQNIEAVTGLGWDFDGRAGDKVVMGALLNRCVELGIEVLVYETFSADDNGTTFRAFFPLKEELAIDCFQAAHAKLADLIGFKPGSILPATQGYFITPRPGRLPNVKANFGTPIDELLDFFLLEAVADAAAPAGGGYRGVEIDPLDMEVWNDEKRELFSTCLTLMNAYSEDRNDWIRIIGAGLRGYGITPHLLAHPEELNEAQRGQIMRLEQWSKAENPPTGVQPKYTPGCVVREGVKLFSPNAPKVAGLRAVVEQAHRAAPEGIEFAIEHEGLRDLALRILGVRKQQPIVEINEQEIVEATTKRQAARNEQRTVAEQQLAVIHMMPACFGKVRDMVVEFASKGELRSFAELTPNYKFKIDPITAILCVAQLHSIILGGRVWVDQALSHTPLGLNLYVLHTGGSGVGKSQMLEWLQAILNNTGYRHSTVAGMSFSLGGFWPNTFDRVGPNVYQVTDEAQNLLGTSDTGNLAANLDTLHTAMLTLYNAGHEGGSYAPPAYSTGGKQKNAHERRYETVAEPHLNIFGIGVGNMVERISNSMFMTNGFAARFIVRITPPAPEEDTVTKIARHQESCYDESEGWVESPNNVSPIAAAAMHFADHLNRFDERLSGAQRGYAMPQLLIEQELTSGPMTDLPPHQQEQVYRDAMKERQLQVRTNQYMRKGLRIGELQAEAEDFFNPYIQNNEMLAAVKNREAEKLQKLGAIYTLAVDPEAKWLNPEITEYMLRILQLAQQDWIGKEHRSSNIPVQYQSSMQMLRREVLPGGLLYEADADGVPAAKLRDKNNAWRKLIKHLNTQDEDMKGLRIAAKTMLDILNVTEAKIGKAATFYLTET